MEFKKDYDFLRALIVLYNRRISTENTILAFSSMFSNAFFLNNLYTYGWNVWKVRVLKASRAYLGDEVLLALAQEVLIGHTGNEITYNFGRGCVVSIF